MNDIEKTKYLYKHIKIFSRLLKIHPRIHKDIIFDLTIFLDEPIFKDLSLFDISALRIKDIDIHSNCIKIYIIDRCGEFHQLNIPIKKKNLTIRYQSFNSHVLYNYIVSKIYCGDFGDWRYYRMNLKIKDRNDFVVFETRLRDSIEPHVLRSMINNLQYEDTTREEI